MNYRTQCIDGPTTIAHDNRDEAGYGIAMLKEHTKITKLSVEGHTDSAGSPVKNLDLTRRRAQAVVNWLSRHGREAFFNTFSPPRRKYF